jgi:putative transposase
MARPHRLVLPGVALHVVQRGNNKQQCFIDDSDYVVYLHRLRECSARTHCVVHAYCLMTNHVHLLLTPASQSACGDLMRDLGRAYVRHFNHRHRRTGTLWEGRFRSCLVDSAAYVLACYRYIELNPVRAGMVEKPGAYKWSSYAANAGISVDPLIVPHPEFNGLSENDELRYRAYQQFTQDCDAAPFLTRIRAATNAGHGLVGDQVKDHVAALGRSLEREKPGPRPHSAEARPTSQELLP